MPIARTPTSQQPGTRHSVTEMWMPFVQVGRIHYSDGSTHILVKGCCPVQDGVNCLRPHKLRRHQRAKRLGVLAVGRGPMS